VSGAAGGGGGGCGPEPDRAPLAAVFLDGDYDDPAYFRGWAEAADIVVAADGGARFLLEEGIRPDVVVGDFDSLPAAAVERLEAAGVELVRYPVRKDRTDGEMAADEALRRGAGELVLAGALGALDHTLGHLAILRRLAARGVAARLAAPQLTVRVFLAPDEARLDASAGTRVSVVPLQGDALVSLEGFDYALERGVLPQDACLGLGNTVVAAALILVHEGVVAVLVEDGDEAFGGLFRRARVAAP
jgi:thiamine pyrophosphokinase